MSDKRFVQQSGIDAFNGNELIVKGALESQVGLMAGYPGSPVAEIFTILEENADILREGLYLRTVGARRVAMVNDFPDTSGRNFLKHNG